MCIAEFKSLDSVPIDALMIHSQYQGVTEKGVPGHFINGREHLSVKNIAQTMRVKPFPPEKRHPAVGLLISKQALQIGGRMNCK